MKAVLIGDIIGSSEKSEQWMDILKSTLHHYGDTPKDWEIYRGDEFQLSTAPNQALLAAYFLKAAMKSVKLDVRLSIGIGDITFKSPNITQQNGTAFVRSGQLFESLKQKKLSLAISSNDDNFDATMNLLLRFASSVIDGWLPQSADYVLTKLNNPELSQSDLGLKLGITQAAVSRRHTRSQIDLLLDLQNLYVEKLNKIA